MGLSMYLIKTKKHKTVTGEEIKLIEDYFDFLEEKNKNNQYATDSFKEYCGHEESELPSKEVIDFYKQYYTEKYYHFDTYRRHPRKMIFNHIADWSKLGNLHQWFVNTIQDGIDDCKIHRDITPSDLKNLIKWCKQVIKETSKENEYYISVIQEVSKEITSILETTDFEKEQIYYVSSW